MQTYKLDLSDRGNIFSFVNKIRICSGLLDPVALIRSNLLEEMLQQKITYRGIFTIKPHEKKKL